MSSRFWDNLKFRSIMGGGYTGSWHIKQIIGQNTKTKERMKQQKQRFIENKSTPLKVGA